MGQMISVTCDPPDAQCSVDVSPTSSSGWVPQQLLSMLFVHGSSHCCPRLHFCVAGHYCCQCCCCVAAPLMDLQAATDALSRLSFPTAAATRV